MELLGLLFMHMHIPLSYPKFPLQPSPNLTQVSNNGSKLNVSDSRRHTGGDFGETHAFRGLFC